MATLLRKPEDVVVELSWLQFLILHFGGTQLIRTMEFQRT